MTRGNHGFRSDESTSTDSAAGRAGTEPPRATGGRAGEGTRSSLALSRRGLLRATAGATTAALGLGAGVTGTALGNVAAFDRLTVDETATVVQDESGNPVTLRGLTIPDPRRLHRTRFLRGKTPIQLIQLVTDNDAGWYPRVIRVPAQPADIGTREDGSHHPMGHTGPEYELGELPNPDAIRDDRRKMLPPQPVAFTRAELEAYLETYYDPIVEECAARGVYCVVDYHRHWHEQPPGEEPPLGAENHLAYDSPYTNYWAYNTHEAFGTDAPASWGWINQVTRNELSPDCEEWDCVASESDVPGTPYAREHWQVNEELLEEALLFWEVVADRYADRPHVLFEPYNEPTEPAIWGPVEGCGAFRQKPLWNTYLEEFMGPILEEIRAHQPEGVLLTGLPGWCQSTQGLHWRDFTDAGHRDIAVTWHNYAGHDVSQAKNWFNDTTYQSPEDVEVETGGELVDPYRPPPDYVDEQACWGWEAYEGAGLQEADQFHPVVVSEFGWEERDVSPGWGGRQPTGFRNVREYGQPFVEAMEEREGISWIAWCADVRWLPRLFEYPGGPDGGAVQDALVNGNFYDTPIEDLPRPCPDVEEEPCEWELLGGPDSGEYLKERLEAYADGPFVPFDLTETTGQPAAEGPCPDDAIAIGDGEYCATPAGDDGLYRDVDGSGHTGSNDIVAFFEYVESDAVQGNPAAFNFNDSGRVGFDDVVALFRQV